ncbi:restriction endonuclease subunit S [Aliibacillus thermotolerans]|uniref:Restriction endonuclease subunit S n=1 Tax=Aliibacillus thermotolerans TaxID=1834418 RepID=A0ABW0UA31_9BACI|nr:restriction endonuclease subunit S [Aliibacillus thermotolerans]MDA3129617.1 restriction endonuclease subunit S [Aliibacillus thermotolerans]
MTSNGWKEVTLGEISLDGKGSYGIAASAVEYSDDLYTYLRITDINDDGTLNKTDLKSVDDEKAEKYLLQPNDIVFARTGNSTGRSYFYDGSDGELVYAGFLIKFSLDPSKVNPKFMRYYTLSNEYKGWVSSYISGSTRGNINAKTYANMKISLPPRKQQDYLVKVLSSLDEKIKTNNQINEKLEEMAQALFKRWFVDFEFPNENGEPYKSSGGEMVESELGLIPKGWEIVSLKELTSKFTTGLNPRKNFVLGKGENFYVTIKNMSNQQILLDDNCDKIDDDAIKIINKRSDLKKGDLLFSGIGTIGRVYLIDETPKNWNISESIFTLRPSDFISSELLYLILLSENLQGYAQQLASGSVQKGIRMRDLKAYKLTLPLGNLIDKFTKFIKPLISKQKNIEKENQILREIRDILLPKLMSGEIRVPLDDEVLTTEHTV